MKLHNTMTPDEQTAFNAHLNERERRDLAPAQTALALMQKRCADFARRWNEWAVTQPNSIICAEHQRERVIDGDESCRVSWLKKEFVVVYTPCYDCRASARPAPAKRKRKR